MWRSGEARTVTVVGLKAEGGGEESDCDSHDISILLRLQGPEALSEVKDHGLISDFTSVSLQVLL